MKFAVVESCRSQAAVIKALIKCEGYEVEVFADGKSCLETLKTCCFDFFIIDWILPDISGDELLKYVREVYGWDVPVIFCTARADEDSVVDILRLGADDFVPKPIRYMELMARIESLLRRCQKNKRAMMHFGDIAIDFTGRRIMLDDSDVVLTQREFDLAAMFFMNVGRLFSRGELLSSIWSNDSSLESRTIDTHASRLRRKLGLAGEHGLVLSSVYGQGYRLDTIGSD